MQKSLVYGLIALLAVVGVVLFILQLNRVDEENMNGSVQIVSQEVETKLGLYQTITADDSLALMKEGAYLVDVRTQEEYNTGHIVDSILIPLDVLEASIESYVEDKSSPVIVYCRSGNRSKSAAQVLLDMGYENVYDLGGITSWPYAVEK